MQPIRTAVLGAGNFGTSLARALAIAGHEVVVWDHFASVIHDIQRLRENRRFLPGITLPEQIRATVNSREAVAGAALVVVGMPSAYAMNTLQTVAPILDGRAVLLNAAKGTVPRTREPLIFGIERLAGGHACVQLAGPALANELARDVPTSIVLASTDPGAARQVARWMRGSVLMPSITGDVMGAALGGILKNVYAMMLGCIDGLDGSGRNLGAAAFAAGVHEMSLVACTRGASPATLQGLAGMGDLAATGFSADSHNRRFGRHLASGRSARQLQRELAWQPEGVRATAVACALARIGGVRAPLANWMRRVLAGTPPRLPDLVRALRAANNGTG